jgi:hypothetical protein
MAPKESSTFVFVHEDYATVIEAESANAAVIKLSEQMSQLTGMSIKPSDYWEDITEGNILVFKSGSYTKNLCVPMNY